MKAGTALPWLDSTNAASRFDTLCALAAVENRQMRSSNTAIATAGLR